MRAAWFSILALAVASVGCRSDVASPRSLRPGAISRSAADGIPTQADADAISANIVSVHLPYGTMADPGFVTSGDTTVETAAIDYILPYWMARYYQVLAT